VGSAARQLAVSGFVVIFFVYIFHYGRNIFCLHFKFQVFLLQLLALFLFFTISPGCGTILA
jgi:hypothetical protein